YCDYEGFLWLGTMDGLNRYDGYSFKIIKSEEGKEGVLTHNRITKIWEDSLNFLWVKTHDNYIHYYIRQTGKFITFPFYFKSIEEKNSIISCFYQANKNEIWLGSTNSGIYQLKYDGKNNKYISRQYLSRGQSSITNNSINFIIQDNNKDIWIGTKQGLNYLSKNEIEKPFPGFIHYFAQNNFTSCAIFKKYLYLGTNNNGILKYDINKHRFIKLDPELDILKVKPINNIQNHKLIELLIVSTKTDGLYLYYPSENRLVSIKDYGLDILSVYEDKKGLLWINTEKQGITMINPYTLNNKHYSLIPDNISTLVDDERPYIYEDSNDNLWIGTHGGGLALYNRGSELFTFYRNNPDDLKTISSNFVHCITEDKSGMLWVGTGQFNGGANKVITANSSFKQIIQEKKFNNYSDNVVRCIFKDTNGYIWMATKSGKIYIYSPELILIKSIKALPVKDNTQSGYNVYTIMQDREGFIWLGTKGGGLLVSTKKITNSAFFYKNLSFFLYSSDDQFNSLNHNSIYSIIQDSKGNIWIGTYGGGLNLVTYRDNNKLYCNHFTSENTNLSGNEVRYIYEDKNSNIWVATTFGLNRFSYNNIKKDTLNFERFFYNPQDLSSISYNDIIYIFEDTKNHLWFGTFGGGINQLKINNNGLYYFKHYNEKDGLINDAVFSILEDKNENIWLATEKGISKFDVDSNLFENYHKNSGLFCDNFCESACSYDRYGNLLFGSISGALYITPETILKKQYSPSVVITNFQLFNRDIDIHSPESPIQSNIETLDSIKLKHFQSSFSFEYAALSYFSPQQNKYSFILENFDNSWNEVGNQRKATYTNIPPGEYIFKVKGSSWDGTWNENPTSIYIKILPPWWKSKIAYFSYIILFIVISLILRKVLLNYYRLNNNLKIERRVNEIKLQFFTDISHEIRTPLTLILGPIEDIKALKNIPGEVKNHILIMERNAKRMLRLINQLLDFRKIQKEKMKLKVQKINIIQFVYDIYQHFIPIAEHKKISFLFEADTDIIEVWVDPKKFDSVVFNILSNAFKYTKDNKVIKVKIGINPEKYAQIEIIDHGPGIQPDKLKYIFQRFTPLSESNSAFEGTGIGLNLSYEIVKLHKGDILITSKENEGSNFTIIIPPGKNHFNEDEIDENEFENIKHINPLEVEAEEISQLLYPLKDNKPKILIVEDNFEIILYLKKILRPFFEIEYAKNGLEGLEAAKNTQPDLIITDVMMPKMDGIKMTKQIKENYELSHIPVIMLTAKSTIEDQIIGIESGAESYILKPFNSEFLKAVLVNMLKQRENIIKKYRDKLTVNDEIKITPYDDSFLNNIVKIIENNYQETDFNVEKLVELSTYSRSVLYNKIKGLTGLSPVEFIRQMRLGLAAKLLRESGKGVSEIAYLTGFNDLKYFRKCFRQIYGMSPSEYKNAG
ncbi:MAG: response regulator, partial [Bacteroidales bacterium]|nr:response regulator [Bacteroidales bacterium]